MLVGRTLGLHAYHIIGACVAHGFYLCIQYILRCLRGMTYGIVIRFRIIQPGILLPTMSVSLHL